MNGWKQDIFHRLHILLFSGRSSDPDKPRYKTACDGQNMTLSCSGDGATIELVRANFGRFSISLCNPHGQMDWSVDCHAPETTKILKDR